MRVRAWMSAANESCIQIADAIRAQGIDDATAGTYVKLVITILYSFLFIVGLIGNGGVIWAVATNRRLRSARNIFLLNLILSDLLLVLTAVPVTPWYALTKDWQFGSAMCHIMPLSNSCSCFVTSWSLTAISIDKFLHINDPTKAPVTKKQASAITLLIWLISSLINVPYLLTNELVDGSYYVPHNATPYCGHFCDETNWQSENSRRLYGTMVMLLQFVVPMAIITYCYFRILEKVSKDMIIQNAQFSASLTQKQRGDAISRKKKVNYILIGMVATFICCWLPLTAVNLIKDFKLEPTWLLSQPFLWPLVAHMIAMSLVIWNPVLFFWLTRKQKRLGLSKIINTSEVLTSFASRIGNSMRRMSTRSSSTLKDSKKRRPTMDSEVSATAIGGSRPLIVKTELRSTPSADRGML